MKGDKEEEVLQNEVQNMSVTVEAARIALRQTQRHAVQCSEQTGNIAVSTLSSSQAKGPGINGIKQTWVINLSKCCSIIVQMVFFGNSQFFTTLHCMPMSLAQHHVCCFCCHTHILHLIQKNFFFFVPLHKNDKEF